MAAQPRRVLSFPILNFFTILTIHGRAASRDILKSTSLTRVKAKQVTRTNNRKLLPGQGPILLPVNTREPSRVLQMVPSVLLDDIVQYLCHRLDDKAAMLGLPVQKFEEKPHMPIRSIAISKRFGASAVHIDTFNIIHDIVAL